MKPQARELRQGLSGADIDELYTDLMRLGYTVSSAEWQASTFGEKTHNAVVQFQSKHGLLETAIVAAANAAELRRATMVPLLPGSTYLMLDSEGFTYTWIYRPYRVRWDEVNSVEVGTVRQGGKGSTHRERRCLFSCGKCMSKTG